MNVAKKGVQPANSLEVKRFVSRVMKGASWRSCPLRQGIKETLEGFRRLQQAGKLDLSDLEQ